MAEYTNNYNLIKPNQNENYDIEQVTRKNADLIDTILYEKVNKTTGKGLSTNDFTNGYKNKVDRMVEGTRGYSAYEIAVQNGFEGTEKEWLLSLTENISTEMINILIENKILEDNKKKYYIGKIIMDTENINPSTYLGFGIWEYWGTGRVPVGVDVNDTDFNTSEKTGGEKTHTLTVEEMPAHIHEIYLDNQSGGYDYSVSAGVKTASGWSSATPVKSIGGNQEHNNIQPYITCYMWKRVS